MTNLPDSHALIQMARARGLHVVVEHAGEYAGEPPSAVHVYPTPKDQRAVVTWQRNTGLVRRDELGWVSCSRAEAARELECAARERTSVPTPAAPAHADEYELCGCDEAAWWRAAYERERAQSEARTIALVHAQGECKIWQKWCTNWREKFKELSALGLEQQRRWEDALKSACARAEQAEARADEYERELAESARSLVQERTETETVTLSRHDWDRFMRAAGYGVRKDEAIIDAIKEALEQASIVDDHYADMRRLAHASRLAHALEAE